MSKFELTTQIQLSYPAARADGQDRRRRQARPPAERPLCPAWQTRIDTANAIRTAGRSAFSRVVLFTQRHAVDRLTPRSTFDPAPVALLCYRPHRPLVKVLVEEASSGERCAGPHRMGAGVREPLHQASTGAPALSRGFTGSPSRLVRRRSGPPWNDLGRLPSVSPGPGLCGARGAMGADGRLSRLVPCQSSELFEICLCLEPHYGIEP